MTTIPKNFYRISVKGLILNKKSEFLLIKEKNGSWDFPGGGLDFGETPKECLERELKEEMNLESIYIGNAPSYFITSKHKKGHYIANIFYEVKLKNIKFIPSDECVEIGFFTVEKTKEINLLNNVKAFLKLYNKSKHK